MASNKRWSLGAVLALAALMTWGGCSEVPGTGRKQLMLISEAQEVQLGLAVWRHQVAILPDSGDVEMTRILEQVSQKLVRVAGRPDFDWELKLVASPQMNAFCLPGGKIVVYTGILPVMKNEAGMAAVVGHEIAHAVARHGAERLSQARAIQVTGRLAAGVLGQYAPEWQNLGRQALGFGTTIGIRLPFSREQEDEADYLGLKYAAQAGYDPEEAIRFWERMMRVRQNGRVPEFLSTHPTPEHRIANLRRRLSEAQGMYLLVDQATGCGREW